MRKIAIQGEIGSYHDLAAHSCFAGEELELVCCDTFEQVFEQLAADAGMVALVAIENTIYGSLLHNYELLKESGASIIGEQKVRISHSLVCLPEDGWEDLREVNSHPVALAQCRDFLKRHSQLRAVEADDTAGAAKYISEHRLHGHAAICSKFAAPLYGMKVLEEGIETNKHNFTRFLVLCSPLRAASLCTPAQPDKASIVFSLPHSAGSLSQVLSIFSFYGINLTKIQSLPIIGREWEYLFYVDVTYEDFTRYRQSIDAIRPLTKQLQLLGEYRQWEAATPDRGER